jgi:hypothetical protein
LLIRLDPGLRPSAFISGRVVGPNGEALAAAKVTPTCVALDYNAMQVTDADGMFRAGPFPAGLWGVRIVAEGFAPFGRAGQPLAADQKLELGTIRLERGDVIDVHLVYPDGLPSARLYVEVQGLDQPIDTWCKIESGHARTPPLSPGRYRLIFNGAYAACTLDTEIVAGQTTQVELALQPGVEFKIRFDDQRVDPTTRAKLVLRDDKGEVLMERSPNIDQAEAFNLPVCLAPGHYRLEASDSSGRFASHEFAVDASGAGQIVPIELR